MLEQLDKSMIARIGLRLVLLLTVVGTIACDRVTKHVASATLAGAQSRSFLADTVRLHYVENTGGFLSLGSDLPPLIRTVLFTIVSGAMLLVLVAAGIRFRWTGWPLLALAFFTAGGASNWVDRATRGSVIDFLNVGVGPLRTGIFNVADMAIMLGVAIFAFSELRQAARTEPLAPASDDTA
jgi:signal peptidase II